MTIEQIRKDARYSLEQDKLHGIEYTRQYLEHTEFLMNNARTQFEYHELVIQIYKEEIEQWRKENFPALRLQQKAIK